MPVDLNRNQIKANFFLSRNWVKRNDFFTKCKDQITFVDEEYDIEETGGYGRYSTDAGKKRVGHKFSVIERELRMAILDLIHKTRKRHQNRGKIDAPKLYRAGADIDLKVFFDPAQVLRISSAFYLLIDLSGSMGGAKLDIAGDLALIFGNVLSRLNIPFEVAGFDSGGSNHDYGRGNYKNRRTECLRYTVYKDFTNRWNNRYRYLNTLSAEGGTPTHDALAVACARIADMKQKKKVILVVTDGQPCLSNVPGYRLQRELQVTVALARRHGIKVIGIGPDYADVHNNFKDFVSVQNEKDLSRAVFDKLKELILSDVMKAKLGWKARNLA